MNAIDSNDKSEEINFLSEEFALFWCRSASCFVKSIEHFVDIFNVLLSRSFSKDQEIVYIGDNCNVEDMS